MSKTWKHQKRWEAKQYWEDSWRKKGPIHIKFQADGAIMMSRPPEKRDINEPDHFRLYKYHVVDNYGNAKWWHDRSNRQCRRKVKKLIKQGKYHEAQYLKPENVEWSID